MLLCISVKLDIRNNKQGPVVKTLYIGKLTDISATGFLKMKRKFYLCNKIFITIDSKHKTIQINGSKNIDNKISKQDLNY